MANRGNRARHNDEVDNTINYVQCDGLVRVFYKLCITPKNSALSSSVSWNFIENIVIRLVDKPQEKITRSMRI